MKYDNRQPCKTCPYRKDVAPGTWHPDEFLNLMRHDANEMSGAQFGCHQYRTMPPSEHRPCIGWMLDQQQRDVPSIQLRMTLMRNKEALACFMEMTDGGRPLYSSIQEMVRANLGARRRQSKTGGRKKR